MEEDKTGLMGAVVCLGVRVLGFRVWGAVVCLLVRVLGFRVWGAIISVLGG